MTNFYFTTALPPPAVNVVSRRPSSDGCGEAMVLDCTTDSAESFVTPPTITWIAPGGSAVSTEEGANPRMHPQTKQLMFSDITTTNSGVYVCRVVIQDVNEATADVNVNTNCECFSLL